MFRGFEARKDADATQRYLIALAAAAIILLLLAGGAVALSDDEQAQDDEPEIIEVRFEELDQPEAPPPPPPPPAPPPPVDKPLAGNTPPEFPPDARAAGIEGEVFLKIVVKEDGTVGDIEVKKGEEPFVSAAVAVVKDWKYSPALVDGKPTAVYRVIKVPFRLKS